MFPKFWNFWEILALLVGIVVGASTFLCIYSVYKTEDAIEKSIESVGKEIVLNKETYNTTLADELFNEVKIMCLVLTHPGNHKTKAKHVKETWGNKCNKLFFLTTANDTELEATALRIEENYDYLWGKVKAGYEQAYSKYFNEFDWFLKADDDSYFIMENLRYMLYQYRPQTSILIGHKYAAGSVDDGYMAGGGYILSKKAVEKFVKRIMLGKCEPGVEGAEDYNTSGCLQEQTLLLDAHDRNHEKEFFPVGFEEYMQDSDRVGEWWYRRNQWTNVTQGGLDCCSEKIACLHYISPREMYMFNYLLYKVYPFGLVRNFTSELPRKFTLDEIVKAANEKSSSPNYKEHVFVHRFDDDELF